MERDDTKSVWQFSVCKNSCGEVAAGVGRGLTNSDDVNPDNIYHAASVSIGFLFSSLGRASLCLHLYQSPWKPEVADQQGLSSLVAETLQRPFHRRTAYHVLNQLVK